MRFYLKLNAFIFVFLVLSWLSGEAGRVHLYDAGFAVRCQVAFLRHDAVMEESLVREYQKRLQAQMSRDAVAVAAPAPTTRPATRPLVDW